MAKDIFKGVTNPHLMDPEVQRAMFEDPEYINAYVNYVNSKAKGASKLGPDVLNKHTPNDLGGGKITMKDIFGSLYSDAKTGVANLGNYIKNNPAMSIGLGGTGLANIAGLVDNDNIGGQLLGLGGGAAVGQFLLPKLMQNVSPQAKVLATLGGGALGSLFDALRQKQEDEYAAQQAYSQRGY